ncbi:hypothetical protein EIN_087710 [Entamoeba invadens IP1]|uniref:hypothetical protein n=1 Tax=Entamoeba invadens IP1 TaxID=370355 RepID=UPI0002C3EE3A|nr:hypothetical protein EIN_087710 [Entamoeba invadens IP1]ELP85449.1 hypothetical protein EIN_087710 [Entamoeba invadens IP1]|eukprot:XP_004184795.1 hypothetical protein EIN_087710 [Entamoeba invadens IP1]
MKAIKELYTYLNQQNASFFSSNIPDFVEKIKQFYIVVCQEIHDNGNTINQLKQSAIDYPNEINRLKEENQNKDIDIKQLNDSLIQFQTNDLTQRETIKSLEDDMKQKDDELASEKRKLDSIKMSFSSFMASTEKYISKLEKTISALRTELADERNKQEERNYENTSQNDLTRKLEMLTTLLKVNEQKNTLNQSQQTQSISTLISTKDSKITELQKTNEQLTNSLQSCQQHLSCVQDDKTHLEKKVSQLETELQSLKNAHQKEKKIETKNNSKSDLKQDQNSSSQEIQIQDNAESQIQTHKLAVPLLLFHNGGNFNIDIDNQSVTLSIEKGSQEPLLFDIPTQSGKVRLEVSSDKIENLRRDNYDLYYTVFLNEQFKDQSVQLQISVLDFNNTLNVQAKENSTWTVGDFGLNIGNTGKRGTLYLTIQFV